MSENRKPTAATVGFGTGDKRRRAAAVVENNHTPERPTRQATRQPIYAPDGKVIAVLVGGALTKTISGSVHMLRSPRAIALDLGAVQAAEAQGVSQVIVTDRETAIDYRSTITELYRHGWRFNRGCGEQIALRLDRWQREGDQVKVTEPPATERVSVAALQLALL